MHPNAALIARYYTAFARRDARGMIDCYHPDVHFSDAVFPDLRGPQAGAMWRMLCERAQDLRIVFSDVVADETAGSARWEAWYTFTGTGRPVHNRIAARFEFRDGRIIRHRDTFPFWRWAAQALGPVGWFLGWSPVVKRRVRAQAAASLSKYSSRPT